MPKGTKPYVKRQRQQVIEAIKQAETTKWLRGAQVQFCERMTTEVCIELLSHGLIVMGEGGYTYRICITPQAKVNEYLRKAKAEM